MNRSRRCSTCIEICSARARQRSSSFLASAGTDSPVDAAGLSLLPGGVEPVGGGVGAAQQLGALQQRAAAYRELRTDAAQVLHLPVNYRGSGSTSPRTPLARPFRARASSSPSSPGLEATMNLPQRS